MVGAVVGGVIGAMLVKKARKAGGAQNLLPAKVPQASKRAMTVVKGFAHDAKIAAKATAGLAAEAAFTQVKNAAEQFVVDVATGTSRTKGSASEPAATLSTPEAIPASAAKPRKKPAAKTAAASKRTPKAKAAPSTPSPKAKSSPASS